MILFITPFKLLVSCLLFFWISQHVSVSVDFLVISYCPKVWQTVKMIRFDSMCIPCSQFFWNWESRIHTHAHTHASEYFELAIIVGQGSRGCLQMGSSKLMFLNGPELTGQKSPHFSGQLPEFTVTVDFQPLYSVGSEEWRSSRLTVERSTAEGMDSIVKLCTTEPLWEIRPSQAGLDFLWAGSGPWAVRCWHCS